MKRYLWLLLLLALLAAAYGYFRPYWQEKPCCGPPPEPTSATTAPETVTAPTLPPPTAAPEEAAAPTAPPPTAAPQAVITIGGVDAAHPAVRPLLGVIAGPLQPADSPVADLTAQFEDVGVTSIRNNDYFDDRMDMEGIFNCGGPTYPSWEGCDPQDDANYFWDASDALFESWMAGGFEPFLRLGGEVQNANPHHDFKGPQNAVQEANWIQAALKVTDRYLHWNGQTQTFTYLDIWTEFPNKKFWDRDNVAFYHFWTQAFVALKTAHPELKIGGPGFLVAQTVQIAEGERNTTAEAFLTYLYQNNVQPDWIGWHIFSNNPREWMQAAQGYRDLLEGRGAYADVPWAGTGFFADTELIVDAWGAARMDLSGAEQDQIYNHQRGAATRTAAWIAMQYSDVTRAYLYRGADPRSAPGDDPEQIARGTYSGLFYGDAAVTYKPVAHAFRLWTRVAQDFPELLSVPLPSANSDNGLWALVARNAQGQMAVLLANVTARDLTWGLSLEGATMENYRIEIYQVDDEHGGRSAQIWTGGPITIPAESVQLAILTPR